MKQRVNFLKGSEYFPYPLYKRLQRSATRDEHFFLSVCQTCIHAAYHPVSTSTHTWCNQTPTLTVKLSISPVSSSALWWCNCYRSSKTTSFHQGSTAAGHPVQDTLHTRPPAVISLPTLCVQPLEAVFSEEIEIQPKCSCSASVLGCSRVIWANPPTVTPAHSYGYRKV